MTKRDKPKMIFRKDKRGPVPIAAIDAEQWVAFPLGTEFNLVPLTKRSLPQLRTYWKALSDTINAAGWTMRPEHLNREIKEALGYVESYRDMTGELRYSPDSIALDAMKPHEFREFFEKAMALLAEYAGFDPIGFLEDRRAA